MLKAEKVAKNTFILYARMAITVFISLYSTRLILDALGVDDFGIFSVVGGAVVMLTFLNNAMSQATQRFMSFAQGQGKLSEQKKIFNVSVVLHLFVGLVLVLLLELASLFLFDGLLKIDPMRVDVAKLIYQFLVISTFVKVISVPYDAVINAHENMTFFAVLGILEAVLKLSIAFYVTYTGFDKLASYGFLMASLSILLLVVERFYCNRKYDEVKLNLNSYFDKPLFKEMGVFASWALLGASGSMIGNYGKGIVLNMFFGTALNAAAGIAVQLSSQLSVFSNIMLKALNPVIAKTEGAGQRLTMIKTSLLGLKMSFYMQMILFVPAFFEMDYIQHLWLKNPPEYSIIFCKLMLIVSLTDQLGITLPSSISAVGNIKGLQMFTALLNMIPLILNYIFFSYGYPPETSLYIAIVFAIVKVAIYVYLSYKICNLSIPIYMRDVFVRCISITLLTGFFTILPSLFMEESIFRLFLTFITGVLVALFLIRISGFDASEKGQIQSALRSIFFKFKEKFV